MYAQIQIQEPYWLYEYFQKRYAYTAVNNKFNKCGHFY